MPPFDDPDWLRGHILDILSFYYPECIDEERGGYIHQFSDLDGHIYDRDPKHLVGTCRFVWDFSIGVLLDGPEWCRGAAEHGLDFLDAAHRDRRYGGYWWELSGRDVADGTKYCYGHAFVLLAHATAARAGIDRATNRLDALYDLIDDRFWEPDHGLCLAEATRDWSTVSEYRGQNGNMHMCEAMLAAHAATGESKYLDRAATIADNVTRRLADAGDGLVWEHYRSDWSHDWEYNRDDPDNLFRPWGYLVGHQAEWAKLLMTLHDVRPLDWQVDRAIRLFDATVDGWDDEYGGLVYTVDRDGEPVDWRKFYWVPAEAIGAAVLLGEHTGEPRYREWYDRLWTHAWDHLVNPEIDLWYRVLTRENEPIDAIDLPTRVKTDYHAINACYEGYEAFTEQ